MFLNCSHYGKLVSGGHGEYQVTNMAIIAYDSTKQGMLAADAHFFVIKMWEQSFQALNAQLFTASLRRTGSKSRT